MSIEAYLKRICTDTAVYWSTPTLNTDGTLDYATGIEIKCFWKEHRTLVKTAEGKEIMSKAMIYVIDDLDEQGMLYHGYLKDLTDAQKADPKEVTKAYEIIDIVKTPSLHIPSQKSRRVLV